MTRPTVWIPAAVVLVVVLFFIISYLNPSAKRSKQASAPPLTRSESNVVQARIDKQHQRAAKDTVAAQAATAAAGRSHAAAHSLRKEALVIHRKSNPHASPVPATDSAIAELQSQLATYGDR